MERPKRTKRPRRKPRYCYNCGKPLHTYTTGRWYHCDEVCMAQYYEEHEPDVSVHGLLMMTPTDEDNEGVSLADLRREMKDIL